MRSKSLIFFKIFTGIILIGCSSTPPSNSLNVPTIPVITTSPEIKDIVGYIESIGTFKSSVTIDIRPQVSGPLLQMLVKEGEWVQVGTPLFHIDPKPYNIKAQEAEALLAIDKTAYKASQKKLERFNDLADKELLAPTEWDELEFEAEKCQGKTQLAEARLNAAKLEQEYCLLTSPIDGRVGKIEVSIGQLVDVGQTLVTISKLDPLIVEFKVTEKEFSKLPKDFVNIQLQPLSSSENEITGTVTFLDNHFEAKSGQLLVRGLVQNAQHMLRPGQSVRVLIPISVASQAKLIPQKTIRYNPQGPYVYIVQEDMTVAIRQIRLGEEHGADQIVLDGLEHSDVIILDGHLRLSPGFKVEIKS